MGQQSGVALLRSRSWGVLALPITRGALPSDFECYEEGLVLAHEQLTD